MYRFSTSSNQAGFRSNAPLSNDQIARYAPSVLATTREVAGVSENVKLNRALWSLADGMAQLKAGVVNVQELVEA